MANEVNINSYEMSKQWFYYTAENTNVKPNHTALYFFILNKWNSLFWKKHFGIPTDSTMESLNIRSYKTYISTLKDLETFGFIKFIERSKNQNTSNVIQVLKVMESKVETNTKHLINDTNRDGKKYQSTVQSDNQSDVQSTVQSTVGIIKQYNNKQLNLLTEHHKEVKSFLKTLENKKETKEAEPYFNNTHLNDLFIQHLELRKTMHKNINTPQAVKLLITKLTNLSNKDPKKAEQLITNAILNGWKSYFPLKDGFNQQEQLTPKYTPYKPQ